MGRPGLRPQRPNNRTQGRTEQRVRRAFWLQRTHPTSTISNRRRHEPMKEDITIHGGKGAYAPGLMDWCMACTRKTFQKETMDVGARMFALAGFMPEVPAGQLRRIAEHGGTTKLPGRRTTTARWVDEHNRNDGEGGCSRATTQPIQYQRRCQPTRTNRTNPDRTTAERGR